MKKNYLFVLLALLMGVNAVKAQEEYSIKDGAGFVDAIKNGGENIILMIQNNIILEEDITISDKTVTIRGPKKAVEELLVIGYSKAEIVESYDHYYEKTITLEGNANVTVENLKFEGFPRETWQCSSANAFKNIASSLTINGCVFEHYHGTSAGAIHNNGGELILNDCIFSKNSNYTPGGGAVSNENNGTVKASGCEFSDHDTGNGGRVLHSEGGTIIFKDCVIKGGTNKEETFQKHTFDLDGTDATFIRCKMTENKGVINSYDYSYSDGKLTLQDCTISESFNSIFCNNTLLIDGCTFINNRGPIISCNLIYVEENPSQIICNSLFAENS